MLYKPTGVSIAKKKIIIFGAGHHGRVALRKCNKKLSKYKVLYFIDNDIKKKNKFVLNKKVIHPNKISNIDFDKIIFCGRHIKTQTKQIKKIGINKSKFIFWGKTKLKYDNKNLKKRSELLTYMIAFVAKEFKKKKIEYWIDYSGLLALIRNQDLAEMTDVDISIHFKDFKKIIRILKKKNKRFKYYYKVLQNKNKILNFHFGITGIIKNNQIEPPGIGFHVNKINNNFLEKNTIARKYSYKLLKNKKTYNYKKIILSIPKNAKKYLKLLYGNTWKKKMEFYEKKH